MMDYMVTAIRQMDADSIENLMASCSGMDLPDYPLELQSRLFFTYGSMDHSIGCYRMLKKTYPKAKNQIHWGYGHCMYQIKHKKDYPQILKDYIDCNREDQKK